MISNPDLPDFDVLWDFSQPKVTEQAFRDLLPLADVANDEGYRLELLTQIARTQGLQGLFEEAHRTLDEVEAALDGASPRVRVRYLLERGRVLNSSGSPAQAAQVFQDAWEVASASEEVALAVDGAHMLAIVAPPDEQLTWNLRALDLAERSADPKARKWIGSLLNNIGWTHHDAGRYEEALDTFQCALAWREQESQTRQIEIARWCLGRTLRSLGRIEEALDLQREVLLVLEDRGETDGYVHEELAECLLTLSDADQARPHFAAAHEALSGDRWLIEHEPERLQRLARMAKREISVQKEP